jgi:hypothetical protein
MWWRGGRRPRYGFRFRVCSGQTRERRRITTKRDGRPATGYPECTTGTLTLEHETADPLMRPAPCEVNSNFNIGEGGMSRNCGKVCVWCRCLNFDRSGDAATQQLGSKLSCALAMRVMGATLPTVG